MSRKGKIARLPEPIREELNRRLYDGQSGSRVLAWLNGLPEALAALDGEDFGGSPHTRQFTDNNLSEWKSGGYQDWLKDEKRVAAIRERAEISMRMARAAGGSMAESLLARIAGEIDEKIEGIGDEELQSLVPVLETIIKADKLRLDRVRTDQKREDQALARQRFQRDTCELFLKWSEDRRAQGIVKDSAAPTAARIERLGELMFGEEWK